MRIVFAFVITAVFAVPSAHAGDDVKDVLDFFESVLNTNKKENTKRIKAYEKTEQTRDKNRTKVAVTEIKDSGKTRREFRKLETKLKMGKMKDMTDVILAYIRLLEAREAGNIERDLAKIDGRIATIEAFLGAEEARNVRLRFDQQGRLSGVHKADGDEFPKGRSTGRRLDERTIERLRRGHRAGDTYTEGEAAQMGYVVYESGQLAKLVKQKDGRYGVKRTSTVRSDSTSRVVPAGIVPPTRREKKRQPMIITHLVGG